MRALPFGAVYARCNFKGRMPVGSKPRGVLHLELALEDESARGGNDEGSVCDRRV